MKLSIFAKKRQTRDGRIFHIYLTTLTRKDGSTVVAAVKFGPNCDAPVPAACPCNIIVDKENANFSSKRVLNKDTGEVIERNTLWVHQYAASSEYVDHSMDDFAD